MFFDDVFGLATTLLSNPAAILTGLVSYWILWVIYARTFHPYASVPGPFWASVSRLWLAKNVASGKFHKVSMTLHEKHGNMAQSS